MSDLSRMLDDLYAMPEEGDVAIDDSPARAPEWSSTEALDEAFASWVPGPSDDASAMERSMVAAASDEDAFEPHAATADWLVESEPEPQPTNPEPVVAELRRWAPSDDDILPPRRRGRGRR